MQSSEAACASSPELTWLPWQGTVTEKKIARVIRSILRFIAQCHAKGVIYRDVKPDNFLFLSKDDNSPLRATDFGLSIRSLPSSRNCRVCQHQDLPSCELRVCVRVCVQTVVQLKRSQSQAGLHSNPGAHHRGHGCQADIRGATCRHKAEDGKLKSRSGTPVYMAPGRAENHPLPKWLA